MVNPVNRTEKTNLLTQKVTGLARSSGNYALSYSLILWAATQVAVFLLYINIKMIRLLPNTYSANKIAEVQKLIVTDL